MKFYHLILLFAGLMFYSFEGFGQTPTAIDDRANAAQNGPSVNIRVLDNDDFGADGPNTDHALTFNNGSKANASAKGASIVVHDNDTPTVYDDDYIVYTPTEAFVGQDSFSYVITDATGDADAAQVIINVSSSTQSFNSYLEDFNRKGQPKGPSNGHYWKYFNDIHPDQDSWEKFVPGDGYAYLTVDADVTNDTDATFPYQTLVFGKIGEGHRIETRMKGAVVNGGLVTFLFTYQEENEKFNEVDIEIVAKDAYASQPEHDIYPPNGWTDARFNTWRNASTTTFLPISSTFQPVKDGNGQNVSLLDDDFHTYTIDWDYNQVDFYIDGILQESFNTNVATGDSEVIIGFRNLAWAGDFKWTGTHTLVVDYLKIESLASRLSTGDENITDYTVSVFPNPAEDYLFVKSKEFHQIQKIQIQNILGKTVKEFSEYQSEIAITDLPKGLYFIATSFSNGYRKTQKFMKN